MGKGGRNRTHGRLECFPRMDSFKLSPGALYWPGTDGGYAVTDLQADRVRVFFSDGRRSLIEISRVPNNYGGARTFLLCPGCGRRVRFLYLRFGRFHCRACSRLNYASQQDTRDELLPYRRAVKLLCDKLHVPQKQIPTPNELLEFWPSKPKWMRWSTYSALMMEYQRLQRKYLAAFACVVQGFILQGHG